MNLRKEHGFLIDELDHKEGISRFYRSVGRIALAEKTDSDVKELRKKIHALEVQMNRESKKK